MEERFIVFCLAAGLWIVAALLYGAIFGFGAFLAVVAALFVPCWLYWRLVVSRPRYVACGAFVGVYNGDRYYLLEGVA